MTVFSMTNKGELLDYLAGYYDLMKKHQNETTSEKIVTLYNKVKKEEFVISFSGHFSAGKSSMINELIGKQVLPKSPIPTSANIVKIAPGKGSARVFFRHDKPVEYDEPYDMEMIKEYCKNKDEIKGVELYTENPLLKEKCSIIDTPGIDAADDADRLITESSLHLVDVMFYVMDYNHVQSEVNLYFLQKLQKANIPFHLIINQVDKHDEEELPFTIYQDRIKQTFDQWGIKPKAIYYSSLVDQDNQYNQFPKIKQIIQDLILQKEEHIRIQSAIQQLLDEHKNYLEDHYDEQLSNLEVDDSEKSQLNQLNTITKQIEENIAKPKRLAETIQDALNTSLKNAYIMPAELRDKAEMYLESQGKDFKVGIIGSKKKTLLEIERRTNDFIEALQKTIETGIQWNVKNKLMGILKDFTITDQNILQQIQEITIEYSSRDLEKLMKPGAKLNGDYVIHYTNDISADIKSKFKKVAQENIESIVQKLEKEVTEESNSLLEEQEEIKDILIRQQEYERLLMEKEEKRSLLNSKPEVPESIHETIQQVVLSEEENIQKMSTTQLMTKKQGKRKKQAHQKRQERESYEVSHVLSIIDQTIQSIESLPGFQTIMEDLQSKKERLENRNLTLALFGAFSAGKSSFANALIGENILPVSPNPTTAVINRIAPTTKNHEHGSVVIQIKEEQTLVDDINRITKSFSTPDGTFDEKIKWMEKENIQENNHLSKVYQDYLSALLAGYQEHVTLLGKQIEISINEFSEYVTDETKACYIEVVDLYYDCSITQQGITLVDTPGADSINARHTNVAFDYIKYADAILYVTYYNHALTRADKDFLMQLGRVKDSFQLDKMFFIVNASDLAQNQSELMSVVDYVEEQLVELGIRFPRIFPLSSKQSMKEKMSRTKLNDQMESFEKNLFHFIHHDLTALSLEAAITDISHAEKLLTHQIEALHLSNQDRENYRTTLEQRQKKLINIVQNVKLDNYEKRLVEKINKQLFYVDERIAIRFHDFFKDKFNPTTVTETGRKAKLQLVSNLTDLLDYVGYELLQEVRAVSLRIEAFLQEMNTEWFEDLNKNSQQVDEQLILPSLTNTDWVTPEYIQAFQSVDLKQFDKPLSTYKGTKSFFVHNEKEQMKEQLYEVLQPELKQYLSNIEEQMFRSYQNQWKDYANKNLQRIREVFLRYVEDQYAVISSPVDVNELQEKQKQIEELLKLD